MSDFRKVFCVYHPQQFITNFCKDPNCLMPLCPSCIGSHNSYHDQSGFRASYLNIFDSLTEVQTLIYDLLVNLEQDKKRNDQILYQIRNLPLLVHQKIVAAKNMVYNGLERAFEELEREVVDGLDRKHEEVGVFARSKVERMHAQLVEGIAELYEMTQNLKTERCLAGMIRFYSEKQAELGNIHSQVTAALYVRDWVMQANENYVPMIEVNQEVIGNIAAMAGRLVNVQYSFPKQIEATTYKETAGTKYGNASQVRRFPPPPPPVILPPAPIIVQQQARTITPPRSRPYPSMTASTPTPAAQSSYYQPHQNQYNPQPQQPQQQQSTSYQSSHHYQPSPPPPPSNPPRNKTPVRQTVSPKKYNYLSNSNYDEQFESLSRKVREIRRENEMLSKPFKNY